MTSYRDIVYSLFHCCFQTCTELRRTSGSLSGGAVCENTNVQVRASGQCTHFPRLVPSQKKVQMSFCENSARDPLQDSPRVSEQVCNTRRKKKQKQYKYLRMKKVVPGVYAFVYVCICLFDTKSFSIDILIHSGL